MIVVRLSLYDPDADDLSVICRDFVLHDVYQKPEMLVTAMDLLLKDYTHANNSRNK